jgi:hypothetical protein
MFDAIGDSSNLILNAEDLVARLLALVTAADFIAEVEHLAPLAVNITLAGLRSRWVKPASRAL